jgi:hypothetical protein
MLGYPNHRGMTLFSFGLLFLIGHLFRLRFRAHMAIQIRMTLLVQFQIIMNHCLFTWSTASWLRLQMLMQLPQMLMQPSIRKKPDQLSLHTEAGFFGILNHPSCATCPSATQVVAH